MIAMQWSLSGLSAELEIDRRTLAKKLAGLKPDETETKGNRTERRWRLSRVVAHLANPDGDDLDLTAERALLTRVQRHKVELELEELKGQLIRVPAVENHWGGMVANMRARLLSLPSKIAAQVASPDKQGAAESAARTLVYEALDAIADSGIPPEVADRRAAQLEANTDD